MWMISLLKFFRKKSTAWTQAQLICRQDIAQTNADAKNWPKKNWNSVCPSTGWKTWPHEIQPDENIWLVWHNIILKIKKKKCSLELEGFQVHHLLWLILVSFWPNYNVVPTLPWSHGWETPTADKWNRNECLIPQHPTRGSNETMSHSSYLQVKKLENDYC